LSDRHTKQHRVPTSEIAIYFSGVNAIHVTTFIMHDPAAGARRVEAGLFA
jgi:hypothetical protein